MPRLNVNIDHVATLRQARRGAEPDPVYAAYIAETAGASGIVVHLREDRRHIQDRDVLLLRQTVTTKLNLEMAPTDEMNKIALDIKPDMVTLVPEKREEITTEGGLDVKSNLSEVSKIVDSLIEAGILVSLFVDPELSQLDFSHKSGAQMVEIHTGKYANSKSEDQIANELSAIRNTVEYASNLGLRVSAGHGLNYQNVSPIAGIEGIEELNIGHSIISRSVIVGIDRAVKEMVELTG